MFYQLSNLSGKELPRIKKIGVTTQHRSLEISSNPRGNDLVMEINLEETTTPKLSKELMEHITLVEEAKQAYCSGDTITWEQFKREHETAAREQSV